MTLPHSSARRVAPRFALCLGLVLMFASCGQPGTPPSSTVPLASRLCNGDPPRQIGTLAGADLSELSGLAASRQHRGTFWAHNDSGDGPRIYAIDRTGARRATVNVNVATAFDWEDIAIDGSSLYIGDIGDNNRARSSIVVHRVQEPALGATSANAATFTLRYPDGAHDAETLMVDAVSRVLVIVTKELAGNSGVYTTPLDAPGALTRVAILGLGAGQLATAGDISTDGAAVVLRAYGAVFTWQRAGREALATTFARAPCRSRGPIETQGEALALTPTGEAYVTASEGIGAPVFEVVAGSRTG